VYSSQYQMYQICCYVDKHHLLLVSSTHALQGNNAEKVWKIAMIITLYTKKMDQKISLQFLQK